MNGKKYVFINDSDVGYLELYYFTHWIKPVDKAEYDKAIAENKNKSNE